MEERKTIEERIAELDAQYQAFESIQNENRRAYDDAEKRLADDLLDHLKDAGYPVNERTKVDIRFYGRTTSGGKNVWVTFASNSRAQFTVEFLNGEVSETSASGIHSRGNDDLLNTAAYYKMVANVLEQLTTGWFQTNMALFFDAIESFTYPEMKQLPFNVYEIKEEKRRLELELKVLNLNLEIGKKVEVYIEGTSRRRRGSYIEMTVEKINAKTISLESRAYGSKVIKKEDALNKIRNIEVKEAV